MADGKRPNWLKQGVGLLLVCWIFIGDLFAQADLFPPKPYPAVYVHDYSGWLRPEEKAFLEEKLRRYADTTSTQIVVMIRPSIGDYDRASYAFELGNRWGIGRKDKNNGIVVLIVTEPPQRGVFIATGYGVEGALPDITAGQIARHLMIPYFKEGRYFEGIQAGLEGIFRALAGEFRADDSAESESIPLWIILLIVIVVFLLLVLLAKRGTLYTETGPMRDWPVGRHRRWGYPDGGWTSSWGGGFGSSGGWSEGGGFGGGSFGGGGAGGSW
ncbi:MAG: TPM domain-containing protein [Saprospiraceae bacterium]|nr:TPM domain-containing protein [Saprospiraceae bacterium]MDW8483319.1 TPM domain-containing protein [Saprospiraceae bacterium]